MLSLIVFMISHTPSTVIPHLTGTLHYADLGGGGNADYFPHVIVNHGDMLIVLHI